jgi:opacity protein-like surface antigen
MTRYFARASAIALIAAASIGVAAAADLPKAAATAMATKAVTATPAVPSCTIASCTGFYAGLDITGDASNFNLIGNGINGSLNAAGTEIGGHAGFRSWNGTVYLGAEIGCAYDIGMNVVGSSIDKFRCMELGKAGGSLTALFGQQQSFTFPQALQNSFVSFYGILGASERYGATGLAGGIGAEFIVAPKVSLTLDYINVNYSGGGPTTMSGLAQVPNENLFRLGINYDF